MFLQVMFLPVWNSARIGSTRNQEEEVTDTVKLISQTKLGGKLLPERRSIYTCVHREL